MTLSSVIFFTSFTNLIWPFGIKWSLIDRVWEGDKGKNVFIILTIMYLYIMGIFSSSSSSIEKCDEVSGMNYAIGLIMVSLFLIIFLEKTDFVVWLAGIFGQYNNDNTQLLIRFPFNGIFVAYCFFNMVRVTKNWLFSKEKRS